MSPSHRGVAIVHAARTAECGDPHEQTGRRRQAQSGQPVHGQRRARALARLSQCANGGRSLRLVAYRLAKALTNPSTMRERRHVNGLVRGVPVGALLDAAPRRRRNIRRRQVHLLEAQRELRGRKKHAVVRLSRHLFGDPTHFRYSHERSTNDSTSERRRGPASVIVAASGVHAIRRNECVIEALGISPNSVRCGGCLAFKGSSANRSRAPRSMGDYSRRRLGTCLDESGQRAE